MGAVPVRKVGHACHSVVITQSGTKESLVSLTLALYVHTCLLLVGGGVAGSFSYSRRRGLLALLKSGGAR